MQIGGIESFYLWDIFWTEVLKHFRHKMFQYLRRKYIRGAKCFNTPNLYNTVIMSYMLFRKNLHSYNYLNVKELLARIRCDIWNLRDSNETLTYNHVFLKQTLNHLAELAKWLSCVVSTYLYDAFDCMSLSCYISIAE